jgi:ribosomal protein L11 methyltransferase
MLLPQLYVQYVISINPESESASILIAQLSQIGFDGFEERDEMLVAVCKKEDLDESAADSVLKAAGLHFTKKEMPNQNWNAIWESSFEPVFVKEFAAVRASFHDPIHTVRHEIVITPKMSFGTGHHATTWLMMAAMEHLDFVNKKVIDFGTGTGVLAILAEKLGAKSVIGIDNDPWCIENASENFEVNRVQKCALLLEKNLEAIEYAEILLANINRHIIIENMSAMKAVLSPGGIWLLSGLLEEDETIIRQKAAENGMIWKETTKRNGWISLVFILKGALC